jgi:hypothetical protein
MAEELHRRCARLGDEKSRSVDGLADGRRMISCIIGSSVLAGLLRSWSGAVLLQVMLQLRGVEAIRGIPPSDSHDVAAAAAGTSTQGRCSVWARSLILCRPFDVVHCEDIHRRLL